ncbi:hypothetical protein ALC62_01405 [Cyphomyrmex costatus]|uniref:Gustatory receptor n=1 Tax=Cyphomyrmex costatus TaxID=456900 RepID=A0A195D3V4_9HYME|nr:hypothetical protein ALC62_01405 [Cyphomyrmex costatus]
MSKTLQSALAPLFIIGSFSCLVLFEYPLGQPRPYFSYLYALIIWSKRLYRDYPFYISQLEEKVVYISGITDFVAILLVPISLYRYKELKICLHELNVINDTLEALGAPNKYQRLRNLIIRITIGCIVYVFSEIAIGFCIYIAFYGNLSVRDVCYFLEDFYATYVNVSSALICATVLGYTCSRFHQVNDCLLVIYSDLFEHNVDYRYRKQNKSILVRERITRVKDRKQFIWILM